MIRFYYSNLLDDMIIDGMAIVFGTKNKFIQLTATKKIARLSGTSAIMRPMII